MSSINDVISALPVVSLLWLAVGATIGLSFIMALLWIVQRRIGDAGIVDVAWSAGIGLTAGAGALFLAGDPGRRVLVAALAMIWSLRLATYLLRDRVLSGSEDGRYQALRQQWGDRFQIRLYFFFQAQAVLAVAFALPILVAMSSGRPDLGLIDGVAVLLWCLAVGGESLADRQLEAFRSNPANRGKTCRSGLWRYSRHPNYFFEWLHWWTYALIGIGASWWWITLVAPMVMLFFVLKVTGIPPTEARALASRGDDYRDYQRTTSAFVPWFPKPSVAHSERTLS